MTTDPLCLVFVPALAAVLQAAEYKKGEPLTEAEVSEIRDRSTCIALPFSAALAMEEDRGELQRYARTACEGTRHSSLICNLRARVKNLGYVECCMPRDGSA